MLRLKALELGLDLYKYQNTTYLDDDEFAHLVSDPIENAEMFYSYLIDAEEPNEGEI
jgi:hypothetical protein